MEGLRAAAVNRDRIAATYESVDRRASPVRGERRQPQRARRSGEIARLGEREILHGSCFLELARQLLP